MPELLHNAIWAGRRERRHEPTLLHLAAAYSLDDTDAVDAARIPVERVGSPILFLSGDAESGIAFGGTPAGLAAAEADAGQQTLRFLASHLGRGTELSASITTPDT